MTKTYISTTEVCFNVCVAGEWTHVSFVPLTLGGSYLTTSDARLQDAIESHRFFGTLVILGRVDDTPPPPRTDTEEHADDQPQSITFCSINDARAWLAEKFGTSYGKIRHKEQIECAALEQGYIITFNSPGSNSP